MFVLVDTVVIFDLLLKNFTNGAFPIIFGQTGYSLNACLFTICRFHYDLPFANLG
jgi:3'-phosphoadenosine 5'-phosphosulfate sulfotransferase (PAPS reductase)/FAD synthetase